MTISLLVLQTWVTVSKSPIRCHGWYNTLLVLPASCYWLIYFYIIILVNREKRGSLCAPEPQTWAMVLSESCFVQTQWLQLVHRCQCWIIFALTYWNSHLIPLCYISDNQTKCILFFCQVTCAAINLVAVAECGSQSMDKGFIELRGP